MRHCDVLIVGGGPAGSSCAWRLKRLGLDVLVLDKAVFPRDKVCAGWITPQVVEALALDLSDYARELVLQPIAGFRTGAMGGRPVATRYPATVSYGIRRCEFDDYLLRRSGADLVLGQALEDLRRDGDGWIANGSIRAPMLVGAGGHGCPVARRLSTGDKAAVPLVQPFGSPGTTRAFERKLHDRSVSARERSSEGSRDLRSRALVAAQEIEFRLGPGAETPVAADTPELYFCRDLKGYGWCVRKGDWLNVGLGREDPRGLKDRVEDFVAALHRDGRIPRVPADGLRGHAYLLHGHGSRTWVADGVLLIGDAAGIAYAQSGEGIRPAVESGLLAAEVIAACRPDFGAGRLDRYPALLRQRLGPPRRLASATTRGLETAVGLWLLGNRRLTRSLVLDRWFLHRSEPALAAGNAVPRAVRAAA